MHGFVVAFHGGESCGGPGQIKTVRRGPGPRVPILLAQHDHEQSEETHILFLVICLPHANFKLGESVRIELTQRTRSGRSVEENDVDRQQDGNCSRG